MRDVGASLHAGIRGGRCEASAFVCSLRTKPPPDSFSRLVTLSSGKEEICRPIRFFLRIIVSISVVSFPRALHTKWMFFFWPSLKDSAFDGYFF